MPNQHASDNVAFGIRVRQPFLDRIDAAAGQEGISRSRYIISAIEEKLSRPQKSEVSDGPTH
jgi:predicted DNA binding CopG/RHH family protein